MTTGPDYYPRLEIIVPTQYDSQVKSLFDAIKKYRICWMAFEMLEDIAQRQKKGLVFSKHRNSILVKSKTNKVLARVWFEQGTTERPKKTYSWAFGAVVP